MAETLRVFVSATKDLEAQRALVGQTLADFPLRVGAEIRRTPAEGTSYESLFELISNVDRLYFLLGQDITAPSGAEWDLGIKLERRIYPLRLRGTKTPAAQEFLRATAPLNWTRFHSREQLAQLIGLDLIDLLLHPENRYGLTSGEISGLRTRRKRLEKGVVHASTEPGGAEGGGVILDPNRAVERDDPVLLED